MENNAFVDTIRRLIQLGRDRAGRGFGKYPLGVRDSLTELWPLLSPDDQVMLEPELKRFDERLARD